MTARRTEKAAPPTAHELRVAVEKPGRTPEADELLAELESEGLTNWAAALRMLFRDRKLGSRVNAWEEQHIDPHGIWLPTLADSQQFVDRLWADLGYTDPPVATALTAEDLEEQPHRVAYANAKEIRLWGDHANLDTVIVHEAAHVIAQRLQVCDLHGPNWFGIYLSLLEEMPRRFDMAALKASAATAGLEWAQLATAGESLMAEAA